MPLTEDILALRVGSDTQSQEKSQIQTIYATSEKKVPKKTVPVEEDDSMRKRILQASLFPSIYSK